MLDLARVVEKLLAFWKMQRSGAETIQSPISVSETQPNSPPPLPSTSLSPRDTAGIRRNNPGNLRPSAQPWVGQTGIDAGFCVFDTPEHGIRALAKLLLIYQDEHGCATVTAIITRWAPPSDHNDTAAYISAVCADTGFGQNDWLHLHEPSVLDAMTVAIIKHENGGCPYNNETIMRGVSAALA